MKSQTVYRQGDVILIPVNSLPEDTKEIQPDNGRVILAYGEVTGHAHALPLKSATQYQAGTGGKQFVKVNEKAKLTHEEHAPVELPVGLYEKRIAREHTPGGERQVAD